VTGSSRFLQGAKAECTTTDRNRPLADSKQATTKTPVRASPRTGVSDLRSRRNVTSGFGKSVIWLRLVGPLKEKGRAYLGRRTMDWFSGKTSIAGTQISNWVLVVVAIAAIFIIYRLVAH
jgi:hypothetical protein